MRSILLLPLVARCLEIIDVCIWHMFVFMSVVVTVWWSVDMFVVYQPLKNIVSFCYSMLYVCVRNVIDVVFPLVVHQPSSPSIWPAVQSLRRGLSTNPGATMWCVCGCS